MRVVARQLKTYGKLAAWRFGAELKRYSTVPLDRFQCEGLAVLCKRRTPYSPVTGGAVVQRHARASEDVDVFNAPNIDVVATAEVDMADLEAARFAVSRILSYRCQILNSAG
jgi:hypothetical protein